MRIARDLESLRREVAALRAAAGGGALALVPTMGALHAGHLALVAAARRAAPVVAASIFVNPKQFGPNEDFATYPRDEEGDLAKLRAAGCDLVWLPTVEAMYPPGSVTVVEVAGPPAEGFEGAHRPGHFRGVATVCAKLFLQTGAAVAMFGEKDWQQLQVVRRMVRDLDLPVRIEPVPTVREPDGLALSSRNRFLTAEERARAPRLAAELHRAAAALAAGRGAPAAPVLAEAVAALTAAGFAVDYFALVEAESLRPLAAPGDAPARLVAAARLGRVRLLDNVGVPPSGG
ncbi:pantoate--beta-alanine ligase [Caldovatus aquaticus]|uniref:Pantothenate synthetase n=1 Tax=Caldovatus aquaticus TaxID=2865671 RepID=A0ABS7EYY8_9PROT|nr:pantoate--beta-alanine ligase [Caldovatus aquaticus]MBW8268429.1 pantoate--beta-alanine ligase [Caldovatus aquaticus]